MLGHRKIRNDTVPNLVFQHGAPVALFQGGAPCRFQKMMNFLHLNTNIKHRVVFIFYFRGPNNNDTVLNN